MGLKYKKNSEENLFGDSYNEEESLEDSDTYYEYDEEISDEDDDDEEDLEEKTEDSDDEDEQGVELSFACEDCDYRWDDYIVGEKEEIENEEFDIVCPMCGSVNISQI
ncbi:MAG: hypothetical protein MUC95_02275 [Spirochaetes bacterium]|jgi:hypothetical protein|nr:hypothetical protein [Spirochaetota bacterium]